MTCTAYQIPLNVILDKNGNLKPFLHNLVSNDLAYVTVGPTHCEVKIYHAIIDFYENLFNEEL